MALLGPLAMSVNRAQTLQVMHHLPAPEELQDFPSPQKSPKVSTVEGAKGPQAGALPVQTIFFESRVIYVPKKFLIA